VRVFRFGLVGHLRMMLLTLESEASALDNFAGRDGFSLSRWLDVQEKNSGGSGS
jgi:hypothetical protein